METEVNSPDTDSLPTDPLPETLSKSDLIQGKVLLNTGSEELVVHMLKSVGTKSKTSEQAGLTNLLEKISVQFNPDRSKNATAQEIRNPYAFDSETGYTCYVTDIYSSFHKIMMLRTLVKHQYLKCGYVGFSDLFDSYYDFNAKYFYIENTTSEVIMLQRVVFKQKNNLLPLEMGIIASKNGQKGFCLSSPEVDSMGRLNRKIGWENSESFSNLIYFPGYGHYVNNEFSPTLWQIMEIKDKKIIKIAQNFQNIEWK